MLFFTFFGGCTRCYGNSVYLHAAVNGNNQALAAVNLAGFDEVGAVRIDFDDDIRGFDFKSAGVGNVAGIDGSLFAGGFIEVLVKCGELFFLDAAVLKKIADLVLVENKRFRLILVFFNQFA